MSFSDAASATAAAGFLEQNGVPARVEASSPNVDLSATAHVLVPGQLVHRARWLWSQAAPSDSELDFLATGRLGDPSDGH